MNKMLAALLMCLLPAIAAGQRVMRLSLHDAIARARLCSVDAAVALNELRSAYWQFRTYRADLLPEVSFSATLPSYRKNYSAYLNPDGSYSFVRSNSMNVNAQISVSQKIWFSGGTLSLNTSADWLRSLERPRTNRFMSIPLALTLNQPVFAANHVRWSRRIEPVRYAEAKAAFISASEDVAMTTITYYFNLILAREQLETARQNLDIAVRLHRVAVEKRKMGQISENDLLQMELNELSAQAALTDRRSAMTDCMFRLRSFLDLGEDVEIVTEMPEAIPDVDITYADALDKALQRNKFALSLRRRQLEADYAVADAKGQMRRIDLFAQIGFTGTGAEFADAYSPLKDNQVVEIGIRLPLLDWGKRRASVRRAESARMVTQSRLKREAMDFNQDLFLLVERFGNQRAQLLIAAKSDSIAARRYATNVETYMIGRISTLDLNDSQLKKDESRQSLVNALHLFWRYFYQLRSLTLWDYVENRPIEIDMSRTIK